MKRTFASVLLSALILSSNTFPTLALGEEYTVAPHPSDITVEENLLLPINSQNSTFIHGGAIESTTTDEDEIQVSDSDVGTDWDQTSMNSPFYTIESSKAHQAIKNYLF